MKRTGEFFNRLALDLSKTNDKQVELYNEILEYAEDNDLTKAGALRQLIRIALKSEQHNK